MVTLNTNVFSEGIRFRIAYFPKIFTFRAFSRLLLLATAVVLVACGESQVACLPDRPAAALAPLETPESNDIAGADVYLDVSASIGGYLNEVPSAQVPEPLHQILISRLPDALDQMVAGPNFNFFGNSIRDVDRNTFLDARFPRAYTDSTSDIGAVLREIAEKPGDNLSLVITDLFLSLNDGAPASNGPIFRPARDIVNDGRAFVLLAIRAPYAGTIYDIPGLPEASVRNYRGERPLFVLAAGPEAAVVEVTDRIIDDVLVGIEPAPYRRVIFSPNPVRTDGAQGVFEAQEPAQSGMGLLSSAAEQSLPTFTIVAEGAPGQVVLSVDTRDALLSDRLPPGANRYKATLHGYFGPLDAAEQECPGGWRVLTPSSEFVTVEELNSGVARFTLLPDRAAMNRVIDQIPYVIDIEVFAGPPSPDAIPPWMTEWGFRTDQGARLAQDKPDFFPALNLDLLGAVLAEAVAARAEERRIVVERAAFEVEF